MYVMKNCSMLNSNVNADMPTAQENKMGEFEDRTEEFQKGLVKEKLDQCTPEQQAMFKRIYGHVDTIRKEGLQPAFALCVRTINRHGRQ